MSLIRVVIVASFIFGGALPAFSDQSANPVIPNPITEPSPTTAPAKTGAVCETATDCHGALPRFCVQCQNGKSGGCAHFSCVNHTCEVKTCDL